MAHLRLAARTGDYLHRSRCALEQLANHIPPGFVDAVEAIEHCQGNLIVIGMGKAGLIGQKLVATFASTGTPSHFLHPAEAVHGDFGRVQPNDVVMLLSYSGETEEITRLLSFLTKLQVTRIAITSTLPVRTTQSEIVLSLGTLNEAGTLGWLPAPAPQRCLP